MSTKNIPRRPAMRSYYEPLIWHPDLDADIKLCKAVTREGHPYREGLWLRAFDAWQAIPEADRRDFSSRYRAPLRAYHARGFDQALVIQFNAALDALTYGGARGAVLGRYLPNAPRDALEAFVSRGTAYEERLRLDPTKVRRWIVERYATLWERGPNIYLAHLDRALHFAITRGSWAEGWPFLVNAASNGTGADDGSVLCDIFPDARDVRPLVDEGGRLLGELKSGEYSELLGKQGLFNDGHVAVVLHIFSDHPAEQVAAAVKGALERAGYAPPHGSPGKGKGRTVATGKWIPLYRLWWEWQQQSGGTKYQFACNGGYSQLPSSKEMIPYLGWWRGKSKSNRLLDLADKALNWLRPNQDLLPLQQYLES